MAGRLNSSSHFSPAMVREGSCFGYHRNRGHSSEAVVNDAATEPMDNETPAGVPMNDQAIFAEDSTFSPRNFTWPPLSRTAEAPKVPENTQTPLPTETQEPRALMKDEPPLPMNTREPNRPMYDYQPLPISTQEPQGPTYDYPPLPINTHLKAPHTSIF